MERRVGARPVESPLNSTRYATRERLRTLANACGRFADTAQRRLVTSQPNFKTGTLLRSIREKLSWQAATLAGARFADSTPAALRLAMNVHANSVVGSAHSSSQASGSSYRSHMLSELCIILGRNC